MPPAAPSSAPGVVAFAAEPAATLAKPVIDTVIVRDLGGAPLTRLVPGDTVLVDVVCSSADGFQSITLVEVGLAHDGAFVYNRPLTGAYFRWTRGDAEPWTLRTRSDLWRILPDLCIADELTDSPDPQTVRFAIVISPLARASAAGEWSLDAYANNSNRQVGALDMAERIEFVGADTLAAFAASRPGAVGVPLMEPSNGAVGLALTSNTRWVMDIRGSTLRGISQPAFAIPLSRADSTIAWTLAMGNTHAWGTLDTLPQAVTDSLAPNGTESPLEPRLGLTLRVPAGIPEQTYAGHFHFRLRTLSGTIAAEDSLPLSVQVASSGFAADSAWGEIQPLEIVAGTGRRAFRGALRVFLSTTNTGVDELRIGLPAGYADPRVTWVSAYLLPAPFADRSDSATAIARLTYPLAALFSNAIAPVTVQFDALAPTSADSVGAPFAIAIDDSRTALGPQGAAVRDADGLANGDDVHVRVRPGATAALGVAPHSVSVDPGSWTAFTVAPVDSFGNATQAGVVWSVSGAVGAVSPTGLFLATTPGSGHVIATAGALAESARVEVQGLPSGPRARLLSRAFGTLLPGAAPRELLRVRLAGSGPLPDTLTEVVLSDVTAGPPSLAQRDASWGPLELSVQPAGAAVANSPPFAVSTVSGGVARFGGLSVRIGPSDSLDVVVRGAAALAAHDGDVLDLVLADASALVFTSGLQAGASWPMRHPLGLAVDGMSAAQIGMTALTAGLSVGSHRQGVLLIRVPANGWATDVLRRVDLVQKGNAASGTELTALELWADDGDAAFDSTADALLGPMRFTGARWEITGLSLPIPLGGRGLIVTAGVAETAAEGGTVALALPTLPDVGLGMASGNSGPVDAETTARGGQVISSADRITVAAAALSGVTVPPGARGAGLLALELRNTYETDRELRALAVTNAVVGPGTLDQRDAELVLLELRADLDADGLLGPRDVDPVLATGRLAGGRAVFGGLAFALPAGETRRLFVTGQVSLSGAADGDVLGVSVAGAIDVDVAPVSTLAGAWPVLSKGRPAVDGLVAAQIAGLGASSVTLGPGDGPIEALDLLVPRNGYRDDVLLGVRVVNAGTATPFDLAGLRLWRDGGDGRFDAGFGDDRDLGSLEAFAGEWRSTVLDEALGAAGARLFVSAQVGAAPVDSATVRLALPAGGLVLGSDADGPIDAAVANPEDLLLTTRPLLATVALQSAASIVGQTVTARLTVRNQGGERITGVTPSIAGIEGDGALSVQGAAVPPAADLDPGASQVFTWTLRADAPGTARLLAGAAGIGEGSGLPRQSLITRSDRHSVYVRADSVRLFVVQSMPFAVDQGQQDVVPLTLTFEHPGAPGASDIRVRGLTVRLERESGAGIVPADLLARVAVDEGAAEYLDRAVTESSGDRMVLDLTRPLAVRPGEPVTVALRIDIAASTTVPDFRLVLADSTAFAAEDATSGAPVGVRLGGQTFPVRSGLARVATGRRGLEVAATAADTLRRTRGQSDVPLGRLRLTNLSDAQLGSELRVGALRLAARDGAGGALRDLGRWFARVRVRSALGLHLDRAVGAADSAALDLALTNVVRVPAGVALDAEVRVDLAAGAPTGLLAARIEDPAAVETRDAATGEPVPVSLVPAPLTAGTVRIEARADTLRAQGRPAFPPGAGIGRAGVHALTLRLRHPGAAGAAALRLDTLALRVLDASRALFGPGRVFDRIVVRRDGAAPAVLADPSTSPGPVAIALGGPALEAGATDSLEVWVDIDPAATATSVEIVIDADDVRARDANLLLTAAVVPEDGASAPFGSGLMRLDPPARRLAVGLADRMPAMLPPDRSETLAGLLTLTNDAPAGAGSIPVGYLRLVARDEHDAALPLGAVVERVVARAGGAAWTHADLAPDSASVTLGTPAPLDVPAAGTVPVELLVVARPAATARRFRLGLDRSDVGVVQPGSVLLSIAVEPRPGQSFPMWTGLAAVAASDLAASVSNFPNPFAAGREATTFVYTLEQPGRVTLRLWTVRGELVRTLLDGVTLGAGLHQSDRWDGRNGNGDAVVNGVYVAELLVAPESGPSQRVLRKVAVVR